MATSPSATPTPITPPRVPIIDSRTGLIDRAWYQFFLSLFRSAETVENSNLGPATQDLSGDFSNLYDQAQLASMPNSLVASLQTQINTVRQEVQTLPKPPLGTMAPLQQANLPWVTFDTTPQSLPTDIGTVAWDGGTTLGIQMTANVLQPVGEAQYFYIKADSTITKGQLIMFTGAVGASGVIKGAPATGLTDGQYLMGVAAEDIATNGFGLVTSFGHVRGWNTTGSPVGEVWADGDILYYNPLIAGGLTKTQPTAPNVKATIAVVVNAAPAGSGDVFVRVSSGSVLGGTDSNVQFGTLANGDLIQYDSALQYWKNVTPASVLAGAAGTPGNGELLIGNGTDFTTANLTAGSNISITNGAGSVTIASTYATSGSTGSVTLAKITSGGTDGSLTFANGLITAFTAPT